MTTQDFNPEEFGKNLAQQAMEVIPAEISDDVKQFIVNTLYKYCVLAGNALSKDTGLDLSAEKAVVICQFIGEWTFHKSIDLVKADIPSELWEQILQKIAFSVFEAAKHSQISNMPQSQSVEYVEAEVIKSYKEVLTELINSGVLNKSLESILSHSNIEDIAKKEYNNHSEIKNNDEKELKMASLAMFMKKLSREKVNQFIQLLSVEDQKKIYTYIAMEDLEKRVDPAIVNSYLKKFNEFLPGVKDKTTRRTSYWGLLGNLNKTNANITNKIFEYERNNIKNFISRLHNGKIDIKGSEGYSPDLVDVINNYFLSKSGPV